MEDKEKLEVALGLLEDFYNYLEPIYESHYELIDRYREFKKAIK